MNKVEECSSTPLKVTVNVNGMALPMEMDTVAAVSITSDATCKAMFPLSKIYRSNLKTYTEEQITLVRNIHVHVRYGSQEAKLLLVVIQVEEPTLLGHNLLKYIKLDLNNCCNSFYKTRVMESLEPKA